MQTRALRWVIPALLLAAPGCGGASISDLCQQACDCSSECNEQELDECIQNGEALEKAAGDLGCSSAFDDYIACLDDNLVCEDGEASVKGACAAEENALGSECSIDAG